MAELTEIFRFPLKSVGRERLEQVALRRQHILPADRHYAVLHEGGRDWLTEATTGGIGQVRQWLPKKFFLRGAAAPQLQAISGGLKDRRLSLNHPAFGMIEIDPDALDDAARLLDWLAPMLPDDHPAPIALVHAPVPLTDDKAAYISILSRSSLRDLETRAGDKFGIDRWRGNLWIDGTTPWAEREWIGREISIGGARLRVHAHITRCAATSACTQSGMIDGDMPALLDRLYGHRQFGIYAEIIADGHIMTGAAVMAQAQGAAI